MASHSPQRSRKPQARPITRGGSMHLQDRDPSPTHKTLSMPIVPSVTQILGPGMRSPPNSRPLPSPPHPEPEREVTPPHHPRPINHVAPPQFLTKFDENWQMTDELLADIERADLQQAQSNSHYPRESQYSHESPPKLDPAGERIRAAERVSPKNLDQQRRQPLRESPKSRAREISLRRPPPYRRQCLSHLKEALLRIIPLSSHQVTTSTAITLPEPIPESGPRLSHTGFPDSPDVELWAGFIFPWVNAAAPGNGSSHSRSFAACSRGAGARSPRPIDGAAPSRDQLPPTTLTTRSRSRSSFPASGRCTPRTRVPSRGHVSDSTFSPAATPFQGNGTAYDPWAHMRTSRTLGAVGGVRRPDLRSLESSPSHEPVALPIPPTVGVRKKDLRIGLAARKPPPRVESTPEPESSGEETASEPERAAVF
ncbi:hypothetical protein C8F04DRAFT_1357350 [Mycena alexandri]|uniref:Uncharacterized protein n=1 Tax=Mycena alexandri TaxID=1745969 RepID=A0AAD6STL1_9AGAR|nr:hypothetical protein C8F04DRAFT_1357350 [Mycena alexandri]